MSLANELAKLEELRRSGALSDAEFTQAKAAILSGTPSPSVGEQQIGERLSEQLAEVKHQNELARIDREWEAERQQYMLADRYGRRSVPTPGMGIIAGAVGGLFGAFWTIMACAITGEAPDVGPFAVAKVMFPLFGVVFTVAAIGYGIYTVTRAQKYEQALAAYKARRDRALSEDQ